MKTMTKTGIGRGVGLGFLFSIAASAVAGIGSPGALLLAQGLSAADKQTEVKGSLKGRLAASNRQFMENKGQWPSQAKFLARHDGLNLWLTSSGWKLDQLGPVKDDKQTGHVVEVSFAGANKNATFTASDRSNTRTDFLRKNANVRNVRRYGEVVMNDVYPGTDVRWYLDGGKPRFDVVLSPNADPNRIKLQLKGAEGITVDAKGDLVLKTSVGEIRQADLMAYQMLEGKKIPVAVDFKVLGKSSIGFEVGDYDARHELVIDPLVYGSYYGGDSGFDEVHGVTADADFGVFITGYTQAPDFPNIAGPYGFALNGTMDAFVSKFQGDAYNHDYSAFIGGSGIEVGQYIALSPDGTKIWVVGTTNSADFPEVSGTSFQPTMAGASDVFIMRFSKSDTDILDPDYATFYGSTGTETLRGAAVAPITGEVVIVGTTGGGLPLTLNAYKGGASDAYLTRFAVTASGIGGIKHSVYVGGNGNDTASGVAVDADDNVAMVGTIASGGVTDTALNPAPYDTTPGVYSEGRLLRATDVFIRKFDTNGNVVFSSLLGGNGDDTAAVGGTYTGSPLSTGNAVAVDPAGNIYVTGIARSFNFPRTRDVFGENFNAFANVFVTKINQDGSQIVYSTNLRTTGSVNPSGIAVDSRGTAFVTGVVGLSLSFPVPPGDPNQPTGVNFGTIPLSGDAIDPTHESPTVPELPTTEGFVLVLTPTATSLLYGSYVGGILDEQVYAPYVDRFGDVWINGGIDVRRRYVRVSSTGAQTIYDRTATMPAALISPFAFKTSTDPFGNQGIPNTPYGILESPFTAPAFIATTNRRDGFLVKKRVTLPTITNLTLNPLDVAGGLGASSVGTITLSGPVPAGGLDVTVTLDNGAASFSPSGAQDTLVIPMAAGATTAQFTVYTTPVTSPTQVNVRATLEGNFQVALLTVQPWLQQLTITPTSVIGGNLVTGRVTLWQAAIVDITIDLSTDSSGLVEFPNGNQVVVPAGVATVTFPIKTKGVEPQTDVPVTASLLGVGKTSFVRLLPANLATVTFNPGRVTSGASSTGTVTLDGEAGSTFVVNLSLGPGTPGYSLDPVQLTFNAGERSKTFTVNTAIETVNTQRVITATRPAQGLYSAQSISGTLFVDAASLIAFTLAPTTINPGQSSTGTVTINVPAGTGGAPVNIVSSNPALVSVPGSVTIAAGATSATFNATASSVALADDTVVTITASRGASSIARQLTVLKSVATLVFNPSTVVGGTGSTGTLSIAAPAGAGGLTFTLGSSTGAVSVPPSVTIAEGATSVQFAVTTTLVGVTTNATITATSTVGSLVATGNLTVNAIGAASVVFNPSRVRGPQSTQMTVSIDAPAPAGGVTVGLTSSNPSIAVIPKNVTIAQGATSITVTVPTRRVSRVLATLVTASAGGRNASAVLTVIR